LLSRSPPEISSQKGDCFLDIDENVGVVDWKSAPGVKVRKMQGPIMVALFSRMAQLVNRLCGLQLAFRLYEPKVISLVPDHAEINKESEFIKRLRQ
jgi:hypothetical protein